jgi:hypothetical protein
MDFPYLENVNNYLLDYHIFRLDGVLKRLQLSRPLICLVSVALLYCGSVYSFMHPELAWTERVRCNPARSARTER